jgi:peptide/nickel transport system ATP-binding protein
MLGILGMLQEYDGEASGEIIYKGKDLLKMPECELRNIRWKEIAMVGQSSMNSFNPMYTIRQTFREMLRLKEHISLEYMKEREEQLMDMVHLDKRSLSSYAHELSGGMKQRAAIALALIYNPKILILDEASTGLDIKTQADVLGTLLQIKREQNMALLFISHDEELGNNISDRMIELHQQERYELP